ncbi:MAG: hypothetical protein IKM49_00060 [Ruminococcus sp.]|nr:hypothetical protein [Ruminococcus sp.]
MKKIRIYIATLAMVTAFSFTGCGNDVPAVQDSVAEVTEASEAETTEITAEEETTETATEAITEVTTEADTTEAPAEEPTETIEASDYKTAYLDVINSAEDSETLKYGLIYLDEDDIPELVLGNSGYWVSMYTYADGEVCTLMNQWVYGAMGNAGYEYVPKMNSVRNYNSDYAGLVRWTGYASNTNNSELDWSTVLETYYFDDKNGNDMPDEDEPYSEKACKIFLHNDEDKTEITEDEALSYNVGEYEYISPDMTLDEIKTALS